MDVFAVGESMKIVDVPVGGCLLCMMPGKPRICFIAAFDADNQYLLDPAFVDGDGRSYPVAHAMERNFGHENCIHYPQARLRPTMTPDCIAPGYHRQGGISSALYLGSDAFVLQATFDHHRVTAFDLKTGMHWNGGVSDLFNTSRWTVEIPDGHGKYQDLANFTA